jgi:hypothetical protein
LPFREAAFPAILGGVSPFKAKTLGLLAIRGLGGFKRAAPIGVCETRKPEWTLRDLMDTWHGLILLKVITIVITFARVNEVSI